MEVKDPVGDDSNSQPMPTTSANTMNQKKGNFQPRGGGNNNGGGGGGGRNSGGPKNFNTPRGGRGGGGGMNSNRGLKSEDFLINQKLKNILAPLTDLPELSYEEVKFSGRNRLYIGNLTNDITDDELKKMFEPYGEIAESFINTEKNFAFLKLDFHSNAEKAKKELDGKMRKNRQLRVRFAPNATIIRVRNLNQYVSNELLYTGFEIFGPIERAIVKVDDRGKPMGEGIVEFTRKSSAMSAVKYCQDKCFFLTSSSRPCVVELFDLIDDNDGFSEKSIIKKNEYYDARENGPRFAQLGSFEHEFGTKWKQLYDLYKQKDEALKREMIIEEEKLEAQMEYVRYEHETERLREQLKMREQGLDRQKREWERRENMADEMRSRDEQEMRHSQENMQQRMMKQDEEMQRRQQENSLFMQAQQLSNMLDQQELNMGGSQSGRKSYDNQNDNRRSFDMMNQSGGSGSGGNGGGNNSFQGGNNQGGYQGNHNQDHGNRYSDGPSNQGNHHQGGGPSRGNNVRHNPWGNNDRSMGGNNNMGGGGGGNNRNDDHFAKRRRY